MLTRSLMSAVCPPSPPPCLAEVVEKLHVDPLPLLTRIVPHGQAAYVKVTTNPLNQGARREGGGPVGFHTHQPIYSARCTQAARTTPS